MYNGNPYSFGSGMPVPIDKSKVKYKKFKTICTPINDNKEIFVIENCINFIPHDGYVTIVKADNTDEDDKYVPVVGITHSMVNLPLMHYLKIEVVYD